MNLKDIIAVSGESGLFRFLAQGRNAIIVEHLETGKRQTVSASAKVSSLEEIAVFTDGEELKLSIVFDRIWEKGEGGPAPDPKSRPEDLSAYFAGIVPEYDRSRVYNSDIKKILHWYNILHQLNLLVREEPEKEEARDEEPHLAKPETVPEPKKVRKSPAKTPVIKKGSGAQSKKMIMPAQRKQG